MIAVDTNLLVYAHREDSPWHDAAYGSIVELAEGRGPWAIPWPCLHEFLAIVTHPKIYAPPTSFGGGSGAGDGLAGISQPGPAGGIRGLLGGVAPGPPGGTSRRAAVLPSRCTNKHFRWRVFEAIDSVPSRWEAFRTFLWHKFLYILFSL